MARGITELNVQGATELQRLVDQLQLQAAELGEQRTAAIQRLEQMDASRQAL